MRTLSYLTQTHLSVLVLDRNSHNPIPRMPIYAEISVMEQLPGEELTEQDWGVAGVQHGYFRNRRIGPLLRNAIALRLNAADFRRLDEDTKRNFLQTIADLLDAEENLETRSEEEIREILDNSVQRTVERLHLADSQTTVLNAIQAFPLGYLATDHVGYVSFDLTRFTQSGGASFDNPLTKTKYGFFVYPMGKEGSRFNALDQGRVTKDAVFAKLSIDIPAFSQDLKILSLPSMQKPTLIDWHLSPGSFAANPAALLGADGCEHLLPAHIALQEYLIRQVVRLVDKPPELNVPEKFRFAYVDEYKVSWQSLGHSLGEILYSLPLAPGESVKLAVIDWSWASVAERNEQTKLTEELIHHTQRDRSITETVHAGLRELQRGSTFMGGAALAVGGSASTGPAGVGLAGGLTGSMGGATSTSSGSRDLAADNVQRLSDSFAQASSAQREINSTVVVQARQEEKESIQTRTFTNYNHSHTLTILYYEVLRHFKVVVQWIRRRPAVLIKVPEKIAFEDETNALLYRYLLEPVLLDASLKPGFAALEKRSTIRLNQTLNGVVPTNMWTSPPWEGDWDFSMFELGIKTTASTGSTDSLVVGYVITTDTLPGQKRYELRYVYMGLHIGGVELHDLNSGDRFNDEPQTTAWLFVKPFDVGLNKYVTIKWKDIAGFQFEKWGDDDWRMDALSIAAFTKEGVFVPLTSPEGQRDVDLYFVGREPSSNSFTWFNRPAARPAAIPPVKSPDQNLSPEEYHAIQKLLLHLKHNGEFYNRVLVFNTDSNQLANQFEAITWRGAEKLIDHAEPYPLETFGDYIAYPLIDVSDLPDSLIQDVFDAIQSDDESRHKWVIERLAELSESDLEVFANRFAQLKSNAEKLITLPTRGVFAEGKLGHCNVSEEIDNTRFWKWEEHPIPIEAPAINPATPIQPHPQDVNTSPTPFPQSLVNIVNPTPAPDPTGLGAALTVLGTPNIFRDMSGRAEVTDLLKRLSDNSISIAGAAARAREIQSKYGSDYGGSSSGGGTGLGGPRASSSQPSAVNQDLHDRMNVLGRAVEKGFMSSEAATDAFQKAVNETTPSFENVDSRYVRPAYTSSELVGIIGESIAKQALAGQGHIVFSDWGKSVSATGFDLASYDPAGDGTLWIVDNKAQFRGIGNANALTGAAFDRYKAELRTFLEKTWPNKAQADLALKALSESRVKLVVTNGFAGDATRFTKGLFDKGLHAFDVRLGKLFGPGEHAAWEAAYKALTLRKAARVTGQRGAATVGGMLFALAASAGVAFLLKSSGSVKEIVGETAATVALDTVLSKLPGGFFASWVIGMRSDRSPEQQRAWDLDNDVEKLLKSIPNTDSLSPEDLKTTRETLKALIESPISIPDPQPPSGIHLPGFEWVPHPDWA